jgi:hypothetical protein
VVEREIIESNLEESLSNVYEELEYRKRLCGDQYPFSISISDPHSGHFQLESKFSGFSNTSPHMFYVLGLLETMIRDKMLSVVDSNTSHHQLGLMFQVASCLALGGYLKGHVIWFGFPRPDRTAFLPGLKAAFQRYGVHEVLDKLPGGYPAHLKDAGIDILGWLDFDDARGARVLVIAQVASGKDWSEKTLGGYIPRFLNWFMPPAPAHSKPAILIPFPIHHNMDENHRESWETRARACMLYDASDFGVIFDRFRVARFATLALSLSEAERSRIDGFSRLADLIGWLTMLLAEVRGTA